MNVCLEHSAILHSTCLPKSVKLVPGLRRQQQTLIFGMPPESYPRRPFGKFLLSALSCSTGFCKNKEARRNIGRQATQLIGIVLHLYPGCDLLQQKKCILK
jgi:ribonuclease I